MKVLTLPCLAHARRHPVAALSARGFRAETSRSSALYVHGGFRERGARRKRLTVSCSGDDTAPGSAVNASSAERLINSGLELFKKGNVSAALCKFDAALKLDLSDEEAQAALYNKACCHAYREEGKEAKAALREALGKYSLRFNVILTDPDMAPFRALPEFSELQTEARMGDSEVGSTFRRDLKLLSEVRAPFRGVRKFIYVGLGMAAGIATIFTLPQVIQAVGGGDGAPELLATLTNLAVNIGGGSILLALFLWEQKKEEEQMAKVQRDETLSRLPLRLSSNRVVELSQLRESKRPVVLVGNKASVERSMKQAERYRSDLIERGMLLLPLVWEEGEVITSNFQKVSLPPKKGFGDRKDTDAGQKDDGDSTGSSPASSLTVEEFEARAKELSAKRVGQVDSKLKAEVVAPGEWKQWVKQVQEAEGVKVGDNVYLVLRLDGRLRKSGKGMPDWSQLVTEIPKLDSLVSKLER